MDEPERENQMSNRFENRVFDSKLYYKAGYVFKFDKFSPRTKLHAKNYQFLIHFNSFLVPWNVSDQTINVARLEIMVCNFYESFKTIRCKVLEIQFSNLQKYRFDAITWIATGKKHIQINTTCAHCTQNDARCFQCTCRFQHL